MPETIRPCTGVPARAITCGIPARGGRCEAHRAMVEAERHNRAYDDPEWRRISRRAIARHRAKHGDWCPGYLVAPHRSKDLTASHPIALAAGGRLLQEPIVECRACNSRRGTKAVA